jgi:hypothetical protein
MNIILHDLLLLQPLQPLQLLKPLQPLQLLQPLQTAAAAATRYSRLGVPKPRDSVPHVFDGIRQLDGYASSVVVHALQRVCCGVGGGGGLGQGCSL